MTWRSFAGGLATVLVTGLLVAGGAAVGGTAGSTASAGTIKPWYRALCFTGDITGAEYDEQGWIVVSGVATNCGNIPGEFTVVPFWPEESYGRVITDQLPVYHVGATTHFRAVLTTDATRAEGICLMGAPARRMDCVTVAPGPDGTLVVGQPPAGSPAWTKRAYVWAEQSGCDPNDPNGICGSCVGVIGVDPQD